jgi:hypothetical protein
VKKGDAGATGAQGPPGTAAVTTSLETEVINQATAGDTTSQKELIVHCPNGPVLGDGYVLHNEANSQPAAPKLRAIRSYPVDANTWLVRLRGWDSNPQPFD